MRAFYLNTTLPENRIDDVRTRLQALGLARDYGVTKHGALVAIMRPNGTPFPDIKAAENAQRQLVLLAYDLFKDAAVAFVDAPSPRDDDDDPKMRTMELTDLSTVIASQTDVTLTQGKRALLAVSDDSIREPMLRLLREMGIEARVVASAREALTLLEDTKPDLLITNLQLPDMHAWELLAKARELDGLSQLLTAVIAEPDMAEPKRHAFGSTVSHVDAYLISPFSMTRFRLSIWLAFRHRAGADF